MMPGRAGFTLIELLVVISIMAVLASFTLVVVGQIKVHEYRSIAGAEMAQIEGALDSYKAKYGVYPPSNANPPGTYSFPQTNSLFPPLYYELCGVTNKTVGSTAYFVTLDNVAWIKATDVPKVFGVAAFINCSKGSGDDLTPAQNFLLELKQNRIGSVSENGVNFSNLITTVGGPDTRYNPLNQTGQPGEPPYPNPYRYVYPGVHNPAGYDLWVDLVIRGKTNVICNWQNGVTYDNTLP